MNQGVLREVLARDRDGWKSAQFQKSNAKRKTVKLTMFAEQRDEGTVCTPDGILHRWGGNLSQGLLLLDIVQNDRSCGAEDQTSSPTVEDLIRLNRSLDGLDHGIGEVAYLNQLEKGR